MTWHRSRSHDRSGGGDRRGDGYDPEQLLKKAVVSSKVSAVEKPSSRRKGELSSKLILKATAEADKSVKESSRRQTRWDKHTLSQAFFCTLLKKLNHEKNSKNRVQEKNSAKFCPKTQPTAGFSLLKNYKKTPFMKKTGIFAPKTQFFPFKTQCTAGLRPELSCRKVYKKSLLYSTPIFLIPHPYYCPGQGFFTSHSIQNLRATQSQKQHKGLNQDTWYYPAWKYLHKLMCRKCRKWKIQFNPQPYTVKRVFFPGPFFARFQNSTKIASILGKFYNFLENP